ncbi:MAG: hypothetical protein GY789_14390 [Hyphomicrobiales bacterium]|nr:hypothetical protein [Hyphomicrobiales bacterium]MCP4998974.1 hypothetical protein [Hyphomicrobiales bacterium]
MLLQIHVPVLVVYNLRPPNGILDLIADIVLIDRDTSSDIRTKQNSAGKIPRCLKEFLLCRCGSETPE